MNRPKNPQLLAALVFITSVLGAAAVWSLWDWSRDMRATTAIAAPLTPQ
jgi:hypothetical protein